MSQLSGSLLRCGTKSQRWVGRSQLWERCRVGVLKRSAPADDELLRVHRADATEAAVLLDDRQPRQGRHLSLALSSRLPSLNAFEASPGGG